MQKTGNNLWTSSPRISCVEKEKARTNDGNLHILCLAEQIIHPSTKGISSKQSISKPTNPRKATWIPTRRSIPEYRRLRSKQKPAEFSPEATSECKKETGKRSKAKRKSHPKFLKADQEKKTKEHNWDCFCFSYLILFSSLLSYQKQSTHADLLLNFWLQKSFVTMRTIKRKGRYSAPMICKANSTVQWPKN